MENYFCIKELEYINNRWTDSGERLISTQIEIVCNPSYLVKSMLLW